MCALSLNQVIGLIKRRRSALLPTRFEKSRSHQLRHHCVRPAILSETRLRRYVVWFVLSQQRPNDPRVFVRHGDTCFSGSQLSLFLGDPAAAAIGSGVGPVDYRTSSVDEQHPKVRVAAFGDAQHPHPRWKKNGLNYFGTLITVGTYKGDRSES